MSSIIIANATLTSTPDQGPVDIRITDDTIVSIQPAGCIDTDSAELTIDAAGLVVLPGLVDLGAHLREPGHEQVETVLSASQAAALGGYTAVHATADSDPAADTAGTVELVARLGAAAGYVQVHPIGAVTVGQRGERLAEIGAMADSAAQVRVFADEGGVHDSLLLRRALEYVKAFDGLVAQHAQDPQLTRDAQANEGELASRLGLAGFAPVAEESVIARDVLLAHHVGSRLHVRHVSTAGAVEVLRWAKGRGFQVTADTTPHHLLLTEAEITGYDPRFKVNPPLRTQTDVDALRAGVADGTIDVIATDHAPYPHEDKECEWVHAEFGVTGLQTTLPVLQAALVDTGVLGWADIARLVSSAPALVARDERQGRPIAVGEPANITLYDAASPHVLDAAELVSLSDNSPFVGRELPGRVVATISAGTPTVLNGRLRTPEEVAQWTKK